MVEEITYRYGEIVLSEKILSHSHAGGDHTWHGHVYRVQSLLQIGLCLGANNALELYMELAELGVA